MSRKLKIWIISVLSAISLVRLATGITMYLVNKWDIRITLKGFPVVTLEYGDKWRGPGATAYGTSTLFPFTDHSLKVRSNGTVNTSTVYAMPQVIDWAKQNGYTFLPLAPGSYPAHHRVAN